MRNKIIIIVLISAFKINAQVNLVMNPSFEDPTTCSPQMSTCPLYILPNWGCNLNTPDCYNICVTNTVFGIPSNLFGYQQPFSGFGYVGLHTYGTFGPNVREIIQGTLLQPLVIGQKYFFSFRVSRGDSGVSFFHDKIGLRLSTSPQNSVSINNWAHISTSQLISDKLNWTKIAGALIADSAYQYIYIGNFFDDNNINLIQDGNSTVGYYYIDDVRGSTDSSFVYSDEPTSLPEKRINNEFLIFPNPADEYLIINQSLHPFKVVSSLGFEIKFSVSGNKIDCSLWPEGIYYIELESRHLKIIIKH